MSTFHDPAADQSTVANAGPLFTALNEEWNRLRHSTAARRTVARWGRSRPALAAAADPHDIIRMIDTAPDQATQDELFKALILLAQSGQNLAARVLLQAMLPKLSQMARDSKAAASIEDRRQLVVAAFWEVVASIRVANRHGRFAGQLALDTRHRVSSHRDREVATDPALLVPRDRWSSNSYQPQSDVHAQAALYPDSDSDLSAVLAWMMDRGKLTTAEVRLMQQVYLRTDPGYPKEQIAADLNLSYPALRKRCSRITTKIKAELHTLHPALQVGAPRRSRTLVSA